MTWPTATDFQEAIQNPRICFSDPDLKNGAAKEDRFGMPLPNSGMFATVYEMKTAAGRWAVKCFLKPAEDHQRRFAAISAHLKAARLKSTVGFDLIPQGIRVHSQWYPILKMEWVDGEPLDAYIAKNLTQPERLMQLTRDWVDLMSSLRATRVAHGDLQHGNVLVTPAGLRLIDYDGMYVPALAGLTSHEDGHRNYQHPRRNGRDFGLYLDNFSAWVIFCSITAVAIDHRLWRMANGGDDCLLFKSSDFQYPDRSKVFQLLEASRPEVKAMAAQFRSMLAMPIRLVPALDGTATPRQAKTASAPVPPAATPSWLSDHLQTESEARANLIDDLPVEPPPAPVAAAEWIIDHLVDRSPPVHAFRTHQFIIERVALLLTFGIIVIAGFLPVILGVVVVALTVGGVVTLLVARYRRMSPSKERHIVGSALHAARLELKQRLSEAGAADAARKRLVLPLNGVRAELDLLPQKIQEELNASQAKLGEIRRAFLRKRQEFADEESRAIHAVEQETRGRTGTLQAQIQQIDDDEIEEIAASLGALQEACVDDRLANASIDDAPLPRIGPKLKADLKARGILTARDVELSRIQEIKGIGDLKARLLMGWKNDIIRYAAVPTALPQDQEFQIRSKVAIRRQALYHQIQSLEESGRRQRQVILERYAATRTNFEYEERQAVGSQEAAVNSIHAKLQRERTRLESAYHSLKSQLSPALAEQDKRLVALNQRAMQQRFEVCKLEKEYDRYNGFSVGRYVLGIIGWRLAG